VNPVKILILTANPTNTARLQLSQEVKNIREALKRSKLRDRFEIIVREAVTVNDLSSEIREHEPDIVHFSGHGAGEHGLAVEDAAGQLKLVPNEAFRETFRLAKKTIKCVFLNACYSEIQAREIYQQIDCVIGMNQPIGDKTAIQFSPQFYAALADGCSFQDAFDHAKSFLELDSNKEAATPIQKICQAATNLFSTPQSITETASPIVQSHPAKPMSKQSQSFGNVSIGGNGNAFNAIQGNNNTVSNNINQSTNSSSELQAAIELLAKLKQDAVATDALTSYQKKRVEEDVALVSEELQKPEPDRNFVDEAIAALKQALGGVITLAEPVTKIAELLAKAWMV
jgi:hypothetical protein